MSGAAELGVRASDRRAVAPYDLGLERPASQRDSRPDFIDRWGAALGEGDDDEVDRLVRLSRADRVEFATSGRLGTMLGRVDPSVGGGIVA